MTLDQAAATRVVNDDLDLLERMQKEGLKPFVRSFKKADGTAIPLLLADRHIRDARGEIVGLRTAMTEVKPEG